MISAEYRPSVAKSKSSKPARWGRTRSGRGPSRTLVGGSHSHQTLAIETANWIMLAMGRRDRFIRNKSGRAKRARRAAAMDGRNLPRPHPRRFPDLPERLITKHWPLFPVSIVPINDDAVFRATEFFPSQPASNHLCMQDLAHCRPRT